MTAKKPPIYAISGPTASGKTALGVKLAKYVGGEVVNFDSVQIYKGIEIATAKPDIEEMDGVPHHLIDYIDPNINYTAVDWASDAARTIADIESRGLIPILVGGTGFYLRTLMRPLFEAPKTDAELRERFRGIHHRHGAAFLHRMLKRVDRELAETLPENDYVRVIRGLEYRFQTGSKLSDVQPERIKPPEFVARIRLFVLSPPRDLLYERIDRRTELHFSRGLIDEVKHLLAYGVKDNTNALGAHAYRRVCEYLRGERDLDTAIERSKQDVRNYAKRQLTWFRRENVERWLFGFGDAPDVFSEMVSLSGINRS